MKIFLQKNGIIMALSVMISSIVMAVGVSFFSHQVMERSLRLKAQSEQITSTSYILLVEHLQAIDKSVRAFALTKEEGHMVHYKKAKENTPLQVQKLEQLFTEQKKELPQYSLVLDTLRGYLKETEEKLENYYKLTDEMIVLVRIDSMEAFKKILAADKGMVPWTAWNRLDTKTKTYEMAFNKQAEADYERAANLNSWMQLLLLIIGLPTTGWVIVRLLVTERDRQQLLKGLDANNRKYLFDSGIPTQRFDAHAQLEEASAHIRKSVEFIKNIAAGKYDTTWAGLEKSNEALNQETLAGELVKMKEQMQSIKEEDDRRNWTNEGLSQLGEILRQNMSLIELSDTFLSALIKYIGANQGGLFIVNEDHDTERFLELKSAYAYNRKKYIDKKILPGEGIVGQVWMEADTIYLKEIPQDYLQIRSGLGGANPANLLLVPLKTEKSIEGVLELASFKLFEEHEIKFVEKIAESLAITFSNAKIGEKTRFLLEQSQQQAEMMKSQEEEMRQNLEEMESTQEEVQRILKNAQHQESYLNNLINQAPYPIYCVNTRYKLTLYNQKFSDYYGFQAKGIDKGIDICSLASNEEERQATQALYDRVFRGESFDITVQNGHTHFVLSYAPLFDEQHHVEAAVVFASDAPPAEK